MYIKNNLEIKILEDKKRIKIYSRDKSLFEMINSNVSFNYLLGFTKGYILIILSIYQMKTI